MGLYSGLEKALSNFTIGTPLSVGPTISVTYCHNLGLDVGGFHWSKQILE